MRIRVASVMLLAMMMVASTMFVVTANALVPGTNVPANTGFSGQGQFRQGMQTGATIQGQGQAGGFAGGAANVPGRISQQQGAGIYVGENSGPGSSFPSNPAGSIGGGQGGPGTCYCIRAPCNCPGSTQSGPLSVPGQFQQNQPLLNQPVQGQQFLDQPVQGQPLNTLPASTGAGNVVLSNAAGARAGTL
jgi:hypothetical protein